VTGVPDEAEAPGATAAEHRLVTERHARYLTLGPGDGAARELWLVCHGYGQLASYFIRHFTPLDDGTRRIVAPEALSRFYLARPRAGGRADERIGATWMTREMRQEEIDDYVRYLERVVSRERAFVAPGAPLVALGFSQGAAAVARWLVRGGGPASRLILWGAGLPPDVDATAAAGRWGALTLVAASNDEFVSEEAVAAQVDALRQRGVPFELVRHDAGHRVDAGTLRLVARGAGD
jgi:predicted esterase